MIIGAVFDFFDGMTARLLHVSSPIGKELDSLADDVTFGVAPSTIIFWQLGVLEYPAFMQGLRSVLPYAAYLMAAFSALRLAKFNLDTRQTTSFIGLPTPANALFWGALILCCGRWFEDGGPYMVFVVLALMLFSCYLLICELPMFALKFKHWGWKGNEVKYIFAALSAVFLLIFGILEGWWIVIGMYVIVSFALWMRSK
jgi:CDP-diacylglycerol--serine O-phosphatidyltransferase